MTRPALPVIFRAEWNDSEKTGNVHVTAVFPTLPGTSAPWTATCYAHVGQHGTCSRDWYAGRQHGQRPATPAEYADLLRELRGIYESDSDPDAVRLDVRRRWTRRHDDVRRAELDRMNGKAAA